VSIGDVLIAHGLVTADDVNQAMDLQRLRGGTLVDCLVRVAKIDPAKLAPVIDAAPKSPRNLAESGLALPDLLNLMIKTIFTIGEVTPSSLVDLMKLPPRSIEELVQEADDRRLLNMLGAVRSANGSGVSELRYGLTEKGMQWAHDAMAQNQYVGPAPVPLDVYCDRIRQQRIANERVTREMIDEAFGDLVISERLVREIGPAVNSGQSVLLYGPSGNGKTSVGERVGSIFNDIIYIPYCFEVDGQVVKVFDPAVHKPIESREPPEGEGESLRREDLDLRWVACQRPFVVTGGELTLEMLDLSFNMLAKYYEAPLHIKALGGVFLIDDFGRQLVSPTALLNRWIVPMESRIEYLKLHTGKSFSIPFDELVIFSTNLSPKRLMDPAFLRRIPYKIQVAAPTEDEYRLIFGAMAERRGLEIEPRLIDSIVSELRDRHGVPLASFQPKFIIEQVMAASRFDGSEAHATPARVSMALSNLITQEGLENDSVTVTNMANFDAPDPASVEGAGSRRAA
jgi:hypothetical protein